MADSIRIESTLHPDDHRRMVEQCERRLCTWREYIRRAVLERLDRERDNAPKIGGTK